VLVAPVVVGCGVQRGEPRLALEGRSPSVGRRRKKGDQGKRRKGGEKEGKRGDRELQGPTGAAGKGPRGAGDTGARAPIILYKVSEVLQLGHRFGVLPSLADRCVAGKDGRAAPAAQALSERAARQGASPESRRRLLSTRQSPCCPKAAPTPPPPTPRRRPFSPPAATPLPSSSSSSPPGCTNFDGERNPRPSHAFPARIRFFTCDGIAEGAPLTIFARQCQPEGRKVVVAWRAHLLPRPPAVLQRRRERGERPLPTL